MAAVASGIMNFWQGLRPEERSALIKGGFDLAGGMAAGAGAEGQARFQTGGSLLGGANANALNTRSGNIDTRARDVLNRTTQRASDFQDQNAQIDAADRLVMDAMGNSPLDFANQRGSAQAKAEIFSKPMVPHYLSGQVPGFMATGLSPKTIQMMTPTAEKEKPYWDAVAMGSKGRFKGPNLGASYGDLGSTVDEAVAGTTKESGDTFRGAWDTYTGEREQTWNEYQGWRDKVQTEMTNLSDQQRQEALQLLDLVEKNEKKGGFWSKLGGIVKVVGPIAAMFIPGVNVAVAAAIAAGSSAAGTKMQGGSWGDAALSGAISGGLAGVGGAIANAGKGAAGGVNAANTAASRAATTAGQVSAGAGRGATMPIGTLMGPTSNLVSDRLTRHY